MLGVCIEETELTVCGEIEVDEGDVHRLPSRLLVLDYIIKC